jgi:poly(hydroxyalkanoate) depolymerase family esterase
MHRAARLAMTLMLGVLGGCAGQGPPEGPAPTLPADGRAEEGVPAGGSGARPYLLHRPRGFQGATPLPLVVMLHGCTQHAADLAAGTRMNVLADEMGFLVLYLEQPPEDHPQRCWNWYVPGHQERDGGEPALIADLTRRVAAAEPVDPHRIYLVGLSAGAAMATLVAVSFPELYAAVGLHSALPYRAAGSLGEALDAMRGGGADPEAGGARAFDAMGERARPIPVILFQGAADEVVAPVNAGRVMEQWRETNARAGAATEEREEEGRAGGLTYRRAVYSTASGVPLMERWMVEGLGHRWSGGSPAGSYTDERGPDASREMLRFFLQHARERR